MKKSILLLLFTLIFLPFKPYAQNSLLWKVSGKGLKERSYIFGTIHLIGKEDFFMPAKVQKAIIASKKLVMEMDISENQTQSMMKQMMMEKSLDSLLSPAQYSRVEKFLSDSLHMGMFLFNHMKPFYTYQFIYTKVALSKELASYELSFTDSFKRAGKPIAGLETLEFQTSLFEKIPLSVQAKMLVEAVDSSQKLKRDLNKLIRSYKQEDLTTLASAGEDDKELASFEGLLLKDRNASWIAKIEKFISEGPVFIAVGAAHLPGNEGILELLKQKGYKVEPVF